MPHLLSGKSISTCSWSLTGCCLHCWDPELTLRTLFPMKDPSKPDGEAVNADGLLKPADQIKWVNSLTEELHPPIPSHGSNEHVGEPGNMPELKKSDVSYYKSQRQRQWRLMKTRFPTQIYTMMQICKFTTLSKLLYLLKPNVFF